MSEIARAQKLPCAVVFVAGDSTDVANSTGGECGKRVHSEKQMVSSHRVG
jgi:hypothetical protein